MGKPAALHMQAIKAQISVHNMTACTFPQSFFVRCLYTVHVQCLKGGMFPSIAAEPGLPSDLYSGVMTGLIYY